MWARVVEFMLAMWLAISPFIFRYPDDAHFFWANDFIVATFISLFSLGSIYKPLRKLHLVNLVTALYLIFLSYLLKDSPMYEALQNYMVLGILILMTAIIPSEADKSPVPWRKYYDELDH